MSSTEMATSIRGALPLLRRPFTPAAVKWKVQTNPKGETGKALVVAFIDARLAGERLNAVCPDFWSDDYTPVEGGLRCTVALREYVATAAEWNERRLTRSDVGWSRGTDTDMDLKALYSDAFKRACVKWGIGVSIYALPQQWLDSQAKEIRRIPGRSKDTWVITQTGLNKLRANYAKWLKEHGEGMFGAPIEHGDMLDAQGDAETRERGSAVEEDATPEAKQEKAAPKKAEPKPADDAPAERELVSQAGVDAITQELLLSTKSGADVKNWLVAAGLTGDIDASLPRLTKDQARKLHTWLKKSRAEGATAEAA